MSLKSFLKKIGSFFSHIFNAAAKTWKKLEPEIQNALIAGSGIIDIINQKVDALPEDVLSDIKAAFPNVPLEKILEGLNEAEKTFKIVQNIGDPNVVTTIVNLSVYLSSLEGKEWAKWSNLGAKTIAAALAPKGTKWDVFESLMVFVYQTFIKKN